MTNNPLFLIDFSSLKNMFEGEENGKKLLQTINEGVNSGKKIMVVTPMACFLRAIYLADPETKIKDIQKTLNFLEVRSSLANFKNEKEVMDEIIMIAKMLGGEK